MPSIPQPLVPDDDGAADAAVTAVLASYAAGEADAAAVVAALASVRLLVPVVAVLTEAETGADGLRREKESEMALPVLVGADGRRAVPAFTGTAALRRWRPDARPIQTLTPQVCGAALGENAAAVVIDVAGPVPFAIEGPLLHAMAATAHPLTDRRSLDTLIHSLTQHAEVTVTRPARRRLLPRFRRQGR
ncbi:SseB family protein [Sphaerisporangium aureirubrum]|uniref:SseB family protein n=1 Tax=Sphaerisporangium aureirubrum TaxID=1544736 RepID=A0ABW1NVD4_9ACTN